MKKTILLTVAALLLAVPVMASGPTDWYQVPFASDDSLVATIAAAGIDTTVWIDIKDIPFLMNPDGDLYHAAQIGIYFEQEASAVDSLFYYLDYDGEDYDGTKIVGVAGTVVGVAATTSATEIIAIDPGFAATHMRVRIYSHDSSGKGIKNVRCFLIKPNVLATGEGND